MDEQDVRGGYDCDHPDYINGICVVCHEPTPFGGPHTPAHTPDSGFGYQVCDCGATRRIDGSEVGKWHTCVLCTHPNWHRKESKKNAREEGSKGQHN